jgi:hypothetical protein
MFMCRWRFGRAAAGTHTVSTIVSFSREVRKALKPRISSPRDHTMAGDKKQPLIP